MGTPTLSRLSRSNIAFTCHSARTFTPFKLHSLAKKCVRDPAPPYAQLPGPYTQDVFSKTHLPGQLASFHRHYDRTTLIPQAPRWPRDCDQEEGGGRQSGQGRKCPAIKH